MKGQFRQLMAACRCVVGLNIPPQGATSTTPPSATNITVTAPPPPDDLMMVKVGNIGRQANESKVDLISLEKVREGKQRYKKKEGVDPPRAERPTREQITIFLALMLKLSSIYLDVAIFVPFGDRALQERAFDTMVFGPSGVWTKIRLHGPPNYGEWLACYKALWVLCLMYDVIDNGFLKRYAERIEQLTKDYPSCWGIIYQADVRTRLEYAPDVRAECEEEHAECLIKNWPTTYDPERPWNTVLEKLALKEKG